MSFAQDLECDLWKYCVKQRGTWWAKLFNAILLNWFGSANKDRISEKLKGKKKSAVHRKAMSKARIKLFDRIGRTGKHERDNYICRKCGSIDNLFAHHILSWKDYPELRFELSNGITLCAEYHKQLHRGKTRNNPLENPPLRKKLLKRIE